MTMWRTCLASGFAAATVARLAAGQPDALAARQILANAGIEAAFVARIDATATPLKPAQQLFNALFVFEGVVWNYSAETGTTILGRSPPGAEGLPATLRPMLARIAPPGAVLTLYPQAVAVDSTELTQRQQPNACIIGCIAVLTRVLMKAGAPDEAGVVLFSSTRRPGSIRATSARSIMPRSSTRQPAAGHPLIPPPDRTFALELTANPRSP